VACSHEQRFTEFTAASRKTNVRRLRAERTLRDPRASIPVAAFLDLLGAQIADELLYTVSGYTQALVEERKEEIDWLGSDFLGGFRRIHSA
jgi:hypothetical protein